MLKIKNLKVEIDGKTVLSGFNLHVKEGEIHAIMGPNGAGKSTLSKVISGHPKYIVSEGEITYFGRDLLSLSPVDRALLGIFVSFQYPVEISGVSNLEFLFSSCNARRRHEKQKELSRKEFLVLLHEKMDLLSMKNEFVQRNVNEGFSGGEKKKNEILQMALFSPKLSVLDEIDSGVDVDSLKVLTDKMKALKTSENSYVLITHYQRLLNHICPDYVHVLYNGKVIKTGGPELAKEIEAQGYDHILEDSEYVRKQV